MERTPPPSLKPSEQLWNAERSALLCASILFTSFPFSRRSPKPLLMALVLSSLWFFVHCFYRCPSRILKGSVDKFMCVVHHFEYMRNWYMHGCMFAHVHIHMNLALEDIGSCHYIGSIILNFYKVLLPRGCRCHTVHGRPEDNFVESVISFHLNMNCGV